MFWTVQSEVLKYSKETLGPLCLRVDLCHPSEKTTTDSQPAVGRNYCDHKINAVGHAQAQVQVDEGSVFLCQRVYFAIYKAVLCCVCLFGKHRITSYCLPVAKRQSISRLFTQSPFFAFVIKFLFPSDTYLIIRMHPTINSHLWLDCKSLNPTSAAPSGNLGKISCHTGEWLLVYWP